MLSHNNLHHIELDSTFDIDVLAVTDAESFRRQGCRLDFTDRIAQFTDLGISLDLQELGSVDDIWEIKVNDVVTCDDVWVNCNHKITPLAQ